MISYEELFENNKKWVQSKTATKPDFFKELASNQNPDYLYIGCSDSRVTAEEMIGLGPGEAFVHRNIANLVNGIDLNVMSVINYAIKHLQVKHIIVCGHYNCGGVKAALHPQDMGILNPWLRGVRDVYRLHKEELTAITDEQKRYNRLVELNVYEQCVNVIKTAALQLSYAQNGYPIVHGWVFDIHSGEVLDLNIDFEGILHDIKDIYNLDRE
jgi:carbonic anhydrase